MTMTATIRMIAFRRRFEDRVISGALGVDWAAVSLASSGPGVCGVAGPSARVSLDKLAPHSRRDRQPRRSSVFDACQEPVDQPGDDQAAGGESAEEPTDQEERGSECQLLVDPVT